MAEQDDADGSSGLGSILSPSRLAQIATTAKLAGKRAAVPVLQRTLRQEVVRLLQTEDPDALREYIDVRYPLVENELPDGYRNALQSLGPQFEDDIVQLVNPQTIMGWLSEPEEWMDATENPEEVEQVRRAGEIIRTHPGGEEWLNQQVLALYVVCGIT